MTPGPAAPRHAADAPGATAASSNDALTAYPRALVESSLEKLLDSDVFRRSERHRRFMRHIVRSALDGRRDRLKEVLLGLELFDRAIERYDPRADPIVRVEAGRVRDKLARYYDGQGANDVFTFSIPVGSYVPHFERRAPAALPERPVETFAVMPFATGGADDDVAFAIGLADQLINLIGRVRDVKVVARISTFKARERELGVTELGKLLHVTRVVDGSIQRQGARMRCIAHIYATRDGLRLWSHVFESTAFASGGDIDLFAFQDHIADVLLAAVAPPVDPAVPPPSPPVAKSVAFDARRRARDLFERGSYLQRRFDAANTGKVVELLEQSIALDPDNMRAQLALAVALIDEVALLNAPSSAMVPRVEAAAERALALDPRDCDAISLRASIAFRFGFDRSKAGRLFADALRMAPNAVSVNYRYAYWLIFEGRFEQGFRHLGFAIELDPLNLALRASRAQLLAYARDYAAAEQEARALLELEPGHLYMHVVVALIHLYQGRASESLPHLEVVVAALPDHPAAYLVRISARGIAGDVAQGERELDALRTRLGPRYASPYLLAMAHACLGDRDAMLDALERAALDRDPLFCSLPVDPLFAAFHADPAFVALRARHGLRPASD